MAGLLDFSRPVAVLMLGVLHFIPDDIAAVIASYRVALAPGSAVAINHASADQDDPVVADQVRGVRDGYRGSANEVTLRTRAELMAALDGFELVAPGLTDISRGVQRPLLAERLVPMALSGFSSVSRS